MKRVGYVFLAMLFFGCSREMCKAQEEKPWEIERLCGKLEHREKIQDRRHVERFSEKRDALRDVEAALYERRENESCCSGSAIETTRTRRGGRFEFRGGKFGNFWLVSSWNGKEYKLPVVYKPGKPSETVCSEQGVQIDLAGKAEWWINIEVD